MNYDYDTQIMTMTIIPQFFVMQLLALAILIASTITAITNTVWVSKMS